MITPDRTIVVGGDGLIGSAVACLLPEAVVTTRRHDVEEASGRMFLDLLSSPPPMVQFDTAFLCAGINGFRENEGNRQAWRANVDGVLAVAAAIRPLHSEHCFLVYVSTGAVEWSDASYARQRAHVEAVLLGWRRAAIVRPEKVTKENAAAFAAMLVACGQKRMPGIYHWPDDPC